MSGLEQLYEIDCIVSECPNYDKSLPGAPFFVMLDFYPIALTVGLAAISIIRQELYLFLLSLCLTANWLINLFFQSVVFLQPGLFPGCGSLYQMPSFSAQQAILFETMIALYMVCWTKKIFWINTLLLHFFSSMVIWARIFIGINSIPQLLVGAIFGLVLGILFHCIIYFLIVPYFKTILKWRIFKWRGFCDTLCQKKKVYISVSK